jgi:hypothetical protein
VKRALVPVLLFLLAAAYMRLGLFIPIEWTDEGVIVYPIWRVSVGEIPYRDFQQMYGPSLFFLGGHLFRMFGSDLAVLRFFLLGLKAATCVMVYLGALRVSKPPFALIAYALAVVLGGLAWPISTTPYASYFGTALCLAGVLSFLALERRLLLGCAVAGLCFGFAATFKQTSGAFAFLSLCLFLLIDAGAMVESDPNRPPSRGLAICVRISRWFVLFVTAAVAVIYLAPRNPLWNLTLLLTPTLFLVGHLALREARGGQGLDQQLRSFGGMIALSLAFLLPLAGYALFYLHLGLGSEILFNTVSGLPSAVDWISPFPAPSSTFLLWQLASLGTIAAVMISSRQSTPPAPNNRHLAVGSLLAVSALALVTLIVKGWQARADEWWFWGSSDLLMGLPFVLVWMAILSVVRSGGANPPGGPSSDSPRERRALALFACYATMALLWLYPAADIWHVVALLPSCLPLLAYGLDGLWRLPYINGQNPDMKDQNPHGWRLRAGLLIGLLVLVLLVPGMRDLLWERRAKPAFAESLPRATGITGDSALYSPTRSGGKLVRYLNEDQRRDEPIFILSAKSLFYFLTDRKSPVQEFEYILYLTAYDSIREEIARALIDESDLIQRIRDVRPLIVDDDFDDHSENVRLMYPRFAQFIRNHYQQVEEFGRFRVLRWSAQETNP